MMKKQPDSFWSEGQHVHTDMIIVKGKEKIKMLLDKLKHSQSMKKKKKIKDEVNQAELEIQQQINRTNRNNY
jgi:hypothetical protein